MSLEQAIAANTEAINRLIAVMSNGHAAAPAAAPAQTFTNVAPPQTQFPGTVAAAPPAAMPPSPFPAAAPGVPPQTQQPCPFNDAASLQAWAYQKYQANPALMPQMEAIIKQHGLERMDLARPDQLPSLYAAINAL